MRDTQLDVICLKKSISTDLKKFKDLQLFGLSSDSFKTDSFIAIIIDNTKFNANDLLQSSLDRIKSINKNFAMNNNSTILFIYYNQLTDHAFDQTTKKIDKEKIRKHLYLPEHRVIFASDLVENNQIVKIKSEPKNYDQNYIGYAQPTDTLVNDILNVTSRLKIKIKQISTNPLAFFDKDQKSFNISKSILDKFQNFITLQNLENLYENNKISDDEIKNDIEYCKKHQSKTFEEFYFWFLKNHLGINNITIITKTKNFELAQKKAAEEKINYSFIDDDIYLDKFFNYLIYLKKTKFLITDGIIGRYNSPYYVNTAFPKDIEGSILDKYIGYINNDNKQYDENIFNFFYRDKKLTKFPSFDAFLYRKESYLNYINGISTSAYNSTRFFRLLFPHNLKFIVESKYLENSILTKSLYKYLGKIYPNYLIYSLQTAITLNDDDTIKDIKKLILEFEQKTDNIGIKNLEILHNNLFLNIPKHYRPRVLKINEAGTATHISSVGKSLFKYLNRKIFKYLKKIK